MSSVTTVEHDDEDLASHDASSVSTLDGPVMTTPDQGCQFDRASHRAIPATEIINPRWVYLSVALAAISFLLLHISDVNFCDPDLWHEMSLFREALVEGRIPTEDRFAYTPTVSPSIHHEWAAGAIFYAVAMTAGANGIMLLKYSLVAAVVAACYWCARQRGASPAVFLCIAPVMAFFSSFGFTTIRAQVFTLAFLASMLCLLEVDQKGRRWWIAAWLPLHLIWLNVHGGFVVGAGLMAIHACEQILRRRPFLHFIPIGAALAALVFVNPYGTQYLPYLMHGLTMDRPLITEWHSLWQYDKRVFVLYLLSLLPVIYAARQLGVRRLTGILVLLATAYAAARHTRHLSLYCVVWTCYVPGYLQRTRLGLLMQYAFRNYGRLVTYMAVIICVVCLGRASIAAPWKLKIPSTNRDIDQGLVCYPVGAVQFLHQVDFQGNLMLPFEAGGYAMWKLHPKVKISIDGRYEVAYQPGLLEEHLWMYQAKPGWKKLLKKYPTDAVLIQSLSPLAAEMPKLTDWHRVYRDGVYEIYTRPGLTLSTPQASTTPLSPGLP